MKPRHYTFINTIVPQINQSQWLSRHFGNRNEITYETFNGYRFLTNEKKEKTREIRVCIQDRRKHQHVACCTSPKHKRNISSIISKILKGHNVSYKELWQATTNWIEELSRNSSDNYFSELNKTNSSQSSLRKVISTLTFLNQHSSLNWSQVEIIDF